jgi:hypothetical protein
MGRENLWIEPGRRRPPRVIHRFGHRTIPAIPSVDKLQLPDRKKEIVFSRNCGVSY